MNANNKKINNKNITLTTKNKKHKKHKAQQQTLGMEKTNDANNKQYNHTDTTMTWGNQLGPKDSHKIRIVLQNIGGIDMADNGLLKLAALQSFMNMAQVDIALMECNVAWNKAPPHLYPAEQMRYWWEACHWSLSHNQQESNNTTYQPGGTGIVVVNQLVHWAQ